MDMLQIILSVLVWGLLHSLLASHKVKQWARRILGTVGNRFYRLAYNVFAGLSFLPVLLLSARTPDRQLYRVPLPWSGLMVLGELIAVVALALGFMQTDGMEFIGLRQLGERDDPPRLTTSGLYRYVRHPLYSAGLAFIWLLPLMTTNILAINLGLTAYVVIGAIFEERKLRIVFGQEYVDYAAHTPMFIPFPGRNKTPG
jgi:protein-S-isoprenylcysteine O-methyltransferase Ste14